VVLPTHRFEVIKFKALLNACDDCVVFGRVHYPGFLQKQRFGNWASFGHQAFIEVRGTRHSTACSKAAVIIIIIFITFIQGIYSYVPETNHVSCAIFYFTASLWFQYVVNVTLVPMINVL
jgi:hypothetical protein